MIMEPFEYAIKKDVRNNPIVREVDEAREREQRTWLGIGGLLVLLLLGSAWQHHELRNYGYKLGEMRLLNAAKQNEGEHLLLQLEQLRSPKRISDIATRKLHMVEPTLEERIVIERVQPPNAPASSVVAQR
jgi:cell division protein FtsL